jgi:16S rRNA (guanine527-N7)-methyltransferase
MSGDAAQPEGVSRETRQRIDEFERLLIKWNARINLIARADEGQIWSRHIIDCLQLAALLPAGADRAIDLGSGAGFPGLILAIATGVRFHLVEADQRKAAFLREAIRVTAAPAEVFAQRVERLAIAPAPVVTARALAPLPKLLSLAQPFLAADGMALFLKGREAEQELTAAAREWHMNVQRIASQTQAGASILQITGLSRVGSHP